MIDRLIEHVAPALPVMIAEVDYSDPLLLVNGDGWSLSVRTAWRVVGPEGLLFSCDSNDAADQVWGLIGETVTAVAPMAPSRVDPALVLSSGLTLEIMSLHPVEPWVFRISGQIWVASPSDLSAFD
jgi:hypothetical protein